jgi:signal transduction histidine kinase
MFATVALAAVALAVGTFALTVPSDLDAQQTTALAFELAVASGFVAAGLWVLAQGRTVRFALLSVAIGGALYLLTWRFSATSWAYTAALLFGGLWLPLMVHMLLAFPSGRLRGRFERGLVAAGYALAVVVRPLPFLFWAGDVPLVCENCPDNLALLAPDRELAGVLLTGLVGGCTVVFGAVVVAHFARARWLGATPRERRALTPVLASVGLVFVLGTAILAATAAERYTLARGLALANSVAFAAVPLTLLAALVRSRAYRAEAIGELVERLGGSLRPDALRDALADALDDPSLEVAYWVPAREGYVDGHGRTVDRGGSVNGRAWTEIAHDRLPLAAIVHDPVLNDEPGLVAATGAAVALALERERLAAALRAQVHEVRASRTRIVEAGDDARRGIERDLHDGAQQRLVSLLLNLKLARRGVDVGDGAPLLDDVEHELGEALVELRALASGILPPALSDYGLAPAVQELADRSPVEVAITAMPERRLPSAAEVAAYFVIAEALANVAKHAHATVATVCVHAIDGRLRVEVSDDGVGGARAADGSGLRGLADRVEALDGRLTITSLRHAGTTLRAELPCAS